MNLLFYLRDFPADDDYGRDYTELARCLSRLGHRVTALTERPAAPRDIDGIECHPCPPLAAFGMGFRPLDTVLGHLRPAGGWDAVLAVEWWNSRTHVLSRSALGSGLPVLLAPWASLNPYAIDRNRLKWLKRVFTRLAPFYYGSRRPTLQVYDPVDIDYARRLGLDWPAVVAPLPVYDDYPAPSANFDWETALGRPLGNRRVLFFNARLDLWQKGYDYLLEGFRQAMASRGPELRTVLVLSGRDPDGPLRGQYAIAERLAEPLCRTGHVIWKGYLSTQERTDMLAHCDMFVYPSRVDGPPRPLREALWRGTPVMATYETGLGRWAESYGAGIPIRQPSAQGVRDAVIEFDAMETHQLQAMRAPAGRLALRLRAGTVALDYQAVLSMLG